MTALSPAKSAKKWIGSARTEQTASRQHFIDLCRTPGVSTPDEPDASSDVYAFEKGAGKVEGGDAFADVWKRGHFAREYKGKRKNLDATYGRLLEHRGTLYNTALTAVCRLHGPWLHGFGQTPC